MDSFGFLWSTIYPWSVGHEFEDTLNGEAEREGQVHVTEDVSEHERSSMVLQGWNGGGWQDGEKEKKWWLVSINIKMNWYHPDGAASFESQVHDLEPPAKALGHKIQ